MLGFRSFQARYQRRACRCAEVGDAPLSAAAIVDVGRRGCLYCHVWRLAESLAGLVANRVGDGGRADVPTQLGALNASGTTPYAAVLLVGVIVGGLVLIGNVKAAWSFSAFTVLLYYGLTNLAALRLTRQHRLYPRWISWLGLLSCLFLAFWVQREVWLLGLGGIAGGLLWFAVANAWRGRQGGASTS